MRVIIINRESIRKYVALCLLVLIIIYSLNSLAISIRKARATFKMPMGNLIVFIDPGHGGIDPGASGKFGITEDKINLKISLILRKFIEQSGGIALMTRDDEGGLYSEGEGRIRLKKNEDLRNRYEMINDSGADIFISIHLNSFPQSQYYGAQTFYQKGHEKSKKLAESIQKELVEVIQNNNHRKAKSIDTIYLLRRINIPGVLVECGFLSNPQEERLLQDDEYQEKIAWAIYTGIIRYLKGDEEADICLLIL